MTSAGANVSSTLTESLRVGDRMLVIELLDTGPGILPEHEHKLFDPFFSTRTTGGGTGLGLSVSRSIVAMHRGMITLTNRKDKQKGACASIILPIQTQ